MARDLHNNINVEIAHAYGQRTANYTSGPIIDRQEYESVEFLIHIHAIGAADADNYMLFKLYAGDDSALSDGAYPTNFDATDPQADCDYLEQVKINATTETGVWWMGYRGDKRYLRLDIAETLTADITVSGVAVLAHSRHGGPGDATPDS